MSEKVILTGYEMRAPGISSDDDLCSALAAGDFCPQFSEFFIDGQLRAESGYIDISGDEKHLPKPSLQKTMRDDVLASSQCVSRLMEKWDLTPGDAVSLPLFVCNGITLEPIWTDPDFMEDWLTRYNRSPDKAKLNFELYQSMPPLMALRTLTNATESFISQAGGIGGNNTTFGGTSLSGFYALNEAYTRIMRGECDAAIAGGSFLANQYSYLAFKNFSGNELRRESTCAVFVLLESEKRHTRMGRTLGWQIDGLRSWTTLSPLYEESDEAPYKACLEDCREGSIIYSGGLTRSSFERETEILRRTGLPLLSWFPSLGHLGAVSLIVNLVTGASLLKENAGLMVNCMDCDPYGRESMIRIANLH